MRENCQSSHTLNQYITPTDLRDPHALQFHMRVPFVFPNPPLRHLDPLRTTELRHKLPEASIVVPLVQDLLHLQLAESLPEQVLHQPVIKLVVREYHRLDLHPRPRLLPREFDCAHDVSRPTPWIDMPALDPLACHVDEEPDDAVHTRDVDFVVDADDGEPAGLHSGVEFDGTGSFKFGRRAAKVGLSRAAITPLAMAGGSTAGIGGVIVLQALNTFHGAATGLGVVAGGAGAAGA